MQNLLYQSWRYAEDLSQELYTADQCRAIDRAAIASGTPGIVLMKRAAEAVVDKLEHVALEARDAMISVVCGTGNNGGDGFLIAKLAHERGWSVRVIEVGDAAKIAGDAKRAREAMQAAGVNGQSWSKFRNPRADAGERLAAACNREHIVIDALLGTGFSGLPRPEFASAIDWVNAEREVSSAKVIAVDIPSGLCSDTGQVVNQLAVKADFTVSFIALKQGLVLGVAGEYVGVISLEDLNVCGSLFDRSAVNLSRAPAERLIRAWPYKAVNDHKYSSSAVAVVGGDRGMGGAAMLAASAALNLGSGIVKLITAPEHLNAVLSFQPELLVTAFPATAGDQRTALAPLVSSKTAVIVVGTGLSDSKWSLNILKESLLVASARPIRLVVDAGAIGLLASDSGLLRQFIRLENTVVTPHSGEALKLLGAVSCGENDVETLDNRLLAAQFLADRLNSTVVLKGPGTLCAYPSQNSEKSFDSSDRGAREYVGSHATVVHCGNAILATGGTGDVLAGMLGSALGQIGDFRQAVESAVVLHAAAADYWRQRYGAHGFTASKLIAAAPSLCNRLGPVASNA